ncbi:M24 family metallopeptidase [Roseomonas populi]|uniref:M24 family metallopeptidase n=1 Tax=Roseomonas populi TaxID=3121582 RepID=A0ABT1X7I2_9PROT|nr:M24 family metallopeptidase [Roseomonas pecuniae]MCR0983358.1 M24 family metallopeptidase [Roseomonas pecuniae]
MPDQDQRIQRPISTAELERRWAAVRAAMAEKGIDVLLMQNNSDHMGGYVKYFTDLPATNGYPVTVVFPRDDLMTIVRQGPFGGVTEPPGGDDGVLRGVKRALTTPSYSSCYYTAPYDPELAAMGLEPYAKARIGLVGAYQVSVALVDHLRKRFPAAEFVEASDLVDRIKVIKSEEEKELVRDAARMQDGAMRAAFAAIKPGMRDREVAAVAQAYSHAYGSEQGIYLCASAPAGTPFQFGQWHYGNRMIREGDQFVLLVENSGPGGMYTELGRSCVLGKASQQMQDEFAFTLESRKFTLDLLKPGTPAATVYAEFNAFMERNGRPKENRLYCHGQGYDMVERPLIRHDEPFPIQADTNIVVHPTYNHRGIMSWVCDNYFIEAGGPSARLHEFPEIITEIG